MRIIATTRQMAQLVNRSPNASNVVKLAVVNRCKQIEQLAMTERVDLEDYRQREAHILDDLLEQVRRDVIQSKVKLSKR